ncbi:hypothetical protein LSH36_975g00002 [Paralvinella palmiformis]|uniref:Uncharacterized protein n=1 Tax=Paralvinella palmiformis TaxID=53620 RepID=A0AAD9IX94_9ANNE|nr:hypothetical protein LSH36_975g00002 [Paralvinella palmiformis]
MKQNTLSLKAHQSFSCPRTKIIRRRCSPPPHHCQYKATKWSRCNPEKGIERQLLLLKRFQPRSCPRIKIVDRRCFRIPKQKLAKLHRHCHYRSRNGHWSRCNRRTGKKHKVLYLKRHQSRHCPGRKVIWEKCKKVPKQKLAKLQRQCHYRSRRGHWSRCNRRTGKRRKILYLKRHQSRHCPGRKVIWRRCNKVPKQKLAKRQRHCHYRTRNGHWSRCNRRTGKKRKVLFLKPHQSKHCPGRKVIWRRCRKRRKVIWRRCRKSRKLARRRPHCQYSSPVPYWSRCHTKTGKESKLLFLKSHQPKDCPRRKVIWRNCAKHPRYKTTSSRLHCEYQVLAAPWSRCNRRTWIKKKTALLKLHQPWGCPIRKVFKKSCRKHPRHKTTASRLHCHYQVNAARWSRCNGRTGIKKKTVVLKPHQPWRCPRRKIIKKKCRRGW